MPGVERSETPGTGWKKRTSARESGRQSGTGAIDVDETNELNETADARSTGLSAFWASYLGFRWRSTPGFMLSPAPQAFIRTSQ